MTRSVNRWNGEGDVFRFAVLGRRHLVISYTASTAVCMSPSWLPCGCAYGVLEYLACRWLAPGRMDGCCPSNEALQREGPCGSLSCREEAVPSEI